MKWKVMELEYIECQCRKETPFGDANTATFKLPTKFLRVWSTNTPYLKVVGIKPYCNKY